MKASQFKVGDRVLSPAGFFGRVTRIENRTVFVTYAEKGGETYGIYTPAWFDLYEGFLRQVQQ